MKSLIISLATIIIALLGVKSVVVWQDTTHDFGDIEFREPSTFNFVFKNISTDTFFIDNVRTTCGCTAPVWTYDPIPPGDTSGIKVIYKAKKRGSFKKKVKVFFSNQRKGETLTVEGYVLYD